MILRLTSSVVFLNLLVVAGAAQQPQAVLQPGLYEVTYSLELPHLESWAIDKTTTMCVRDAYGTGVPMLPVLSDNTPFADCLTDHVLLEGANLTYDIVCKGRDSARAHATYRLASNAFSGRIAMVMGAKNMTMTEVQVGHLRGRCDLASAPGD